MFTWKPCYLLTFLLNLHFVVNYCCYQRQIKSMHKIDFLAIFKHPLQFPILYLRRYDKSKLACFSIFWNCAHLLKSIFLHDHFTKTIHRWRRVGWRIRLTIIFWHRANFVAKRVRIWKIEFFHCNSCPPAAAVSRCMEKSIRKGFKIGGKHDFCWTKKGNSVH